MRLTILLVGSVLVFACGTETPCPPECDTFATVAHGARNCDPEVGCEDPTEPMDMDGDGIADHLDDCPDQPETFNGVSDSDGCPEVAAGPIPPEFAGVWTGPTGLTINNAVTFTQTQAMTITLSPDRTFATLAGFCPNGGGSLRLTWANGSIVWSGVYTCPGDGATWAQCARAGTVFFGIRATLTTTGVSVVSSGSASFDDNDPNTTSSCDVSGEFVTSHAGLRQ